MRLSAAIRASARDGPYAIADAIPGGSRLARDQKEWLLTALALVDAQPWYRSRKRAYAEMIRQLARFMDWQRKTSRPGHAALGHASGRSADTVGRCVAWLQSAGLAGLVDGGWTPDLKPASLREPGETNQAALYVLTVPKKSESAPPPDSPLSEFADLSRLSHQKVLAPRTREAARDSDRPAAGLSMSRTPGREHGPDRLQRWPLGRKPENRDDGECAARALQERLPVLGRISARYLRSLTMRYYAAGWTPLDVIAALDYDRHGRQHGYRDPIRHLAGWIRARLAEHDQADGEPGEPPGAAAERDHQRSLGEQRRRRADAERAAAERDPAAVAARLARIVASITPADSAAERRIMTGRGPAAARLRELLALGRQDHPSPGQTEATSESLEIGRAHV